MVNKMGAYAYCSCEAPLSSPTLREAFKQEIICGNCGESFYIDSDSFIDMLEDMEKSIDKLNKKVKKLKRLK